MAKSQEADVNHQRHDALQEHGYCLVQGLLQPEQVKTLRAASHRVIQMARDGKWPYLRTLPKQFPPWSSSPEQGVWGVQHLLHPDQPECTAFAEIYFGDAIINNIKSLLQYGTEDAKVEDSELVMELFNMLIRPDLDFELKWHRDDISSDACEEEEFTRLGLRRSADGTLTVSSRRMYHAQYNIALYDDSSLVVIPGSHIRPRTLTEREADPCASELPNMKIVQLHAGDCVFYNNNILHRGVYDKGIQRITLHGSVGHIDGGPLRARNVLQHSVADWVTGCDFTGLKGNRERAEVMRQRLLELGRSKAADNVGFTHVD